MACVVGNGVIVKDAVLEIDATAILFVQRPFYLISRKNTVEHSAGTQVQATTQDKRSSISNVVLHRTVFNGAIVAKDAAATYIYSTVLAVSNDAVSQHAIIPDSQASTSVTGMVNTCAAILKYKSIPRSLVFEPQSHFVAPLQIGFFASHIVWELLCQYAVQDVSICVAVQVIVGLGPRVNVFSTIPNLDFIDTGQG